MKTIRKIKNDDGTVMCLNCNYNDNVPGSKEVIEINEKALSIIDNFIMKLNIRAGIAGEETYF